MQHIPQDDAFDSSLSLKAEGYEFIANRCRRFGSDIFSARLLGKEFYCVTGDDAAAMFYEPDRFTRQGALPTSVLHLLQDEGSVATLDADAHRHRKAMLMSLMVPERLASIADIAAEELLARARELQGKDAVMLFDEFRGVLCKAACRWAGVSIGDQDLRDLTEEISAMIDNAGSVGPSNWIARTRRRRCERFVRRVMEEVRAGFIAAPAETAAHVIAFHRDLDGEPLPIEICAVEMLNILRPTVAIAQFMTFAMLAIHEHPEAKPRLASDDSYLDAFVGEVRRFYPFFPAVAGIARKPFEWREFSFKAGDRFILDLYGTTHDERAWDAAASFRPERFLGWKGNAFTMIPQGGGDHYVNHRCAGEWLTIDVMKAMIKVMVRDIAYDAPPQDLSVDLSAFPARPSSGFLARITAVRS